jgi:hypothetical protein
MNVIVFLVIIILVVVVAVVAVVALIGALVYFMVRANTQRYKAATEDAVERWAEAEGYEVISSKEVDRKGDHPFSDRFGARVREHGDYGAVVFEIVVEDRDGEEREGWLYVPLKGRGGVQVGGTAVAADWQNAEVAWERD